MNQSIWYQIHNSFLHNSKQYQTLCDVDSSYFKKNYTMLGTFSHFKQKEKDHWSLPKDYFERKDRFEIDLAINQLQREMYQRFIKKMEKKINNIGKSFIEENISKKILIRKKTDCCLCLDHCKHRILTNCGHEFGKLCFAKFLDSKYQKKEHNIVCPLCRSNNILPFVSL